MEVIRGFLADAAFVRLLFTSFDRAKTGQAVLGELLRVLWRVASDAPEQLGLDRSGLSVAGGAGGGGTGPGLTIASAAVKTPCIDQLDKAEPPRLPETYLIYLVLTCFLTLADNVSSFILPLYASMSSSTHTAFDASLVNAEFVPYNPAHSILNSFSGSVILIQEVSLAPTDPERHPQADAIQTTLELVTTFWPSLLTALTYFAGAHLDADLFHSVLRSMQNFTITCGVLATGAAFDAFLATLSRLSLPGTLVRPVFSARAPEQRGGGGRLGMGSPTKGRMGEGGKLGSSSGDGGATGSSVVQGLSQKNITCLRALISVSLALSSILSESAWYIVLDTLCRADRVLFGKNASSVAGVVRSVLTKKLAGGQDAMGVSAQDSMDIAESELTSLDRCIKDLFIDSKLFPDDALCRFVKALAQLCSDESGLNLTLVSTESPYTPKKPFVEEQQEVSYDANLSSVLLGHIGYNSRADLSLQEPRDSADTDSVESKHSGDLVSSRVTLASPTRPTMRAVDEKAFSLSRLKDVVLCNLERLVFIHLGGPFARTLPSLSGFILSPPNLPALQDSWDLLISLYVRVATQITSSPVLKQQACLQISEVLMAIVGIAEKALHAKGKSDEESARMDEFIQLRILQPLNQLTMLSPIPSKSMPISPVSPSDNANPGLTLLLQQQEVQKAGLEILNKVLQATGQAFTSPGYAVIFEILTHAAAGRKQVLSKEASVVDPHHRSLSELGIIRVAFPALQLICTDFLGNLSLDNLKQCIETIGTFAYQTEDMNISLTSIGLLWTVSDFSRSLLSFKESKNDSNADAVANNLARTVLLQLVSITHDNRPEIRNTAVQTLFRAISMTYGPKWKSTHWVYALDEIIFPVVSLIRERSREARETLLEACIVSLDSFTEQSTESINSTVPSLGTAFNKLYEKQTMEEKEQFSRSAVLKQWDDTKVLLLGGLAQVISEYMVVLSEIEGFNEGSDSPWNKILKVFYGEFCGSQAFGETSSLRFYYRPSHDVVVASIRGFRQILQWPRQNMSSFDQDAKFKLFLNNMWRECWRFWCNMAFSLNERKEIILRTLEEMNSLGIVPDKAVNAELTDFVYREETLVSFLSIFQDLWFVLNPNGAISASLTDDECYVFGIRDLKKFYSALLSVVTYLDLSIDVSTNPFGRLYSEISTIKRKAPKAYPSSKKSPSLENETLSQVQQSVVDLVLGVEVVSTIKTQNSMASTYYFSNDEERIGGIKTPIWRELTTRLDATLRENGIICELIMQLIRLCQLGFRKSFHQLNTLAFQEKLGGLSLLVSTATPCALHNGIMSKSSAITSGSSFSANSETTLHKMMSPAAVARILEMQEATGVQPPSFIALTRVILHALKLLFDQEQFQNNVLLYQSGTFDSVLLTLGVPMALKYHSCAVPLLNQNSGKRSSAEEIWYLAVKSFEYLSFVGLDSMRRLKLSDEKIAETWDILRLVLENNMLSPSLPTPDTSMDSFDEDEQMEVNFIYNLLQKLLPLIGDSSKQQQACPDTTVNAILTLIAKSSRFYDDVSGFMESQNMVIHMTESKDQLSSVTVIPVFKENWARFHLQLLFSFVSEQPIVMESIPQDKQPLVYSESISRRLSELAAPIVMDRCGRVLDAWIRDSAMYGNFPLPRYE